MCPKNLISVVLSILIIFGFSHPLLALMPPQIVDTTPHHGGLLQGNTIKFYGYSLQYADIGDLRIIDLTSSSKVKISTDISCKWKGKGNCPGCQQQYCTLQAILLKVYPGHEYEANFLNWKIRFTSTCNSETCPHIREKLFRFEKDEKWGFMDGYGKVVIKPKFIIAHDFSAEGIAAVADENSWYYIDKTGNKLITPFIFDNGPDYFKDGLSRFTANKKYGFFNKFGKTVIEAKFDFAWPFNEGLAVICMGCKKVTYDEEHWEMIGGKWGYINKKGKIVLPLKFESASHFKNGTARVKLNGKWIFIDKNGKITR